MPQVRPIRVRAPLLGIRRVTDFQNTPGGSLYNSRDFWPYDPSSNRECLAVRPGFATYNAQSTVNLISSINVAPSETSQRLLITAAGGNLYTWESGTPTSRGSGIDTGRNVQAAVYLDTIYIANDTPKKMVFDGSPAVETWAASDGTVPTNARLICEWDNRIVMAGVTTAPHLWYMSRMDDPDDWLYAADDDASPVAATDIEGGQIGGPITAIIPHNRECILICRTDSITVLRGNPVAGGNTEQISHIVGPVNATAWCKTADDWTYFLTKDGLYRMPPGCGSTPESISREIIPNSLIGLDGISTKVYMAYDVRMRMIHIYTEGSSAQRFHYFPKYDPKYSSFWAVTTPGSSISAIGRFEPAETATESGVLIGTASGIRYLSSTATLGGATLAFATFNPIRLAQGLGEKSQIQRAVAAFVAGEFIDDNGTVGFYAGHDGESVLDLSTSRKSQWKISSFTDGHAVHPRVGGQTCVIHIAQSSTSSTIAFEELTLYVVSRGRERG